MAAKDLWCSNNTENHQGTKNWHCNTFMTRSRSARLGTLHAALQ